MGDSKDSAAPISVLKGAPRHIAIIMDGNGRWAKKRLLPRQAGHISGIAAVRRTVRASQELGLEYLTLFAFSTENWRRPQAEVRGLMGLFRRFFHADIARLQKENVRVRFIGRRTGLDFDIAELIEDAERMTAANTGLNLTVAFNYGGREELTMAARKLARDAAAGKVRAGEITEDSFARCLQTSGFPDVDLVIRPGGEKRISNFLLWQAAYAEIVFIDTLWPDFRREHLVAALEEFARRERRFGGVGADEAPVEDIEAADLGEYKTVAP